ncbi:EscU/YscU/HrcU family type III secretion system export apparatus switch protein [Vibrio caribbeanicus]|uniref:EscU/YscU/HrcU family type III secretion system export apparatus switch protein n=1 Tax=Vibrio caribbeanicus TaxID=701175 RepID=UPI0030D7EE82
MSTEEKNEDATPYKLEQSRKKGQIAKSADFNAIGGVLVFLLSLCFLFEFLGMKIQTLMKSILTNPNVIMPENNTWMIGKVFSSYLMMIMPVMFVSIIVSVTFNLLQTRGLISFYPLKPDLKKINPIKGFKKIFSRKTVFELLKSIVRLIAIICFSYYFFSFYISGIHDDNEHSMQGFFVLIYDITLKTILLFLVVMGPFLIVDFRFQLWTFLKEMRMSKKEVKDEYKNQEGDPEIKQKRKKRQKELSEKLSALSAVSSADIIITNPVHVAVALKFDQESMIAPKVIAKGKGNIADRIKDIAQENQIIVKVNIPLARKIYSCVSINAEIPPEIYDDVATIYRWLYSLEK